MAPETTSTETAMSQAESYRSPELVQEKFDVAMRDLTEVNGHQIPEMVERIGIGIEREKVVSQGTEKDEKNRSSRVGGKKRLEVSLGREKLNFEPIEKASLDTTVSMMNLFTALSIMVTEANIKIPKELDVIIEAAVEGHSELASAIKEIDVLELRLSTRTNPRSSGNDSYSEKQFKAQRKSNLSEILLKAKANLGSIYQIKTYFQFGKDAFSAEQLQRIEQLLEQAQQTHRELQRKLGQVQLVFAVPSRNDLVETVVAAWRENKDEARQREALERRKRALKPNRQNIFKH